ncbi:uncharacterized protein LOC116010872 [Ipomoea triloba]|uniref:uncharacterized protein LOC116010872 n=1 Tax=Ipomoea triloba TaxID=35885 RepID=UPI00125D02EA|nr:uncharacterized protein LOC116010872 [Ipomoea triloba]
MVIQRGIEPNPEKVKAILDMKPPTTLKEVQRLTDRAANSKHCGGGVMLTSPEGFKVYYALIYKFKASNNEAEYEAMIGSVRLAIALGARKVRIRTDSRLVVGQIKGTFEAKGENMRLYKDVVEGLLTKLETYEIHHVLRLENQEADILSKLFLGGIPDHLKRICKTEIVDMPSTETLVIAAVFPLEVRTPDDWIEELVKYITQAELPNDPKKAAKIKRRAPTYVILDGQLYKKFFGGPLLKCLLPQQAQEVIEEVHQGVCAVHQGANTLTRKLIIQGYYWPSMIHDCIQKVLRCEIISPNGSKLNHWSPSLITNVEEHLITDNGRQFDNQAFTEFCSTYAIRHTKVSVAYPQGNGQVENANRTIMEGLKKRIEEEGGAWVDQLDYILWAYRTTPRRATRETPFSLTYGFEAKVPVEILNPTRRVQLYDDQTNEETMQIEKNFLEERRDVAERRVAEYQRSVKRYQDARTNPKYFDIGDLVLRDREASQPTSGGKMAKKWEGPYRVSAIVRPGTYKSHGMEYRPTRSKQKEDQKVSWYKYQAIIFKKKGGRMLNHYVVDKLAFQNMAW